MTASFVRILDGNTFVLSDNSGDIEASPANPVGFFSFDTRFLSRWVLSVNGQRLNPLATHDRQYFDARFFLVPGTPTHYVDAQISVIRERTMGTGFEEQLTVLNHADQPTDLTVELEADSDFTPLLGIAQHGRVEGRLDKRVDDGRLYLRYTRQNFHRETIISTTEPAEVDEHGLTFHIHIGPQSRWATTLQVRSLVLRPDGDDVRDHLDRRYTRTKSQLQHDLDQWLEAAPDLKCDWDPLEFTYRRSLVDLAALRHSPLALPDQPVPAAGLPWASTTSGRDSIFTSLQAMPIAPGLARATLRLLGYGQGGVLDDFRDEEPGKILREFRYGELVAFGERPQSPYYGSADATPLYVVLLDEYERWTGDTQLVRDLEGEARAALDWIDEYGDIMGDGYVWYRRRNEQTGLDNQCWKESWNSISYRDGRLPGVPRATCELQGYAYDAKVRGARLARQFWNDPAYADRLERQAADLKERFNRDFWVEDGQYYALALDADGGQVDALASNMGHLLWSGIVEPSRAAKVAEHLVGPRLFSGWGVRTLATGQGRYNPIGYQVGTVWPFDNSFIAEGIIDAAQYFDGRLPEAFAGYDREATRHPVEYPTASNPQAWSTGAPFLMLRTILSLEPYEDDLVVEPAVPQRFGRIEMLNIPGRWGRADAVGSV
jgi:glycogen debranching enzyme